MVGLLILKEGIRVNDGDDKSNGGSDKSDDITFIDSTVLEKNITFATHGIEGIKIKTISQKSNDCSFGLYFTDNHRYYISKNYPTAEILQSDKIVK